MGLAAAVRVVDGVHGDAASLGPLAPVPRAAGLAQLDQLVLGVADRADRGPRLHRHQPHFARGKPQRGVLALLGHQLDRGARRAADLAAAPGGELDVVQRRTRRDGPQGKAVAHLDLGALARRDRRADPQPRRRQDVALLAVGVVQQRDVGAAVGVVLDRGHLGGNAVLEPLEVDLAVATLVPATAVAGGDPALGVAPAGLRDPLGERLLGLGLGDLRVVGPGGEPASWRGWLVLAYGHLFAELLTLEEFDAVLRVQRHDRLLPAPALPRGVAAALGLGLDP